MIAHGYLAKPGDANDLAQGVLWILANETRRQQLGAAARTKAEQSFSMETQVKRYMALYQELSASGGHAARKSASAWANE